MDQASLEVRDKLEVLRLPLEAKQPVLLPRLARPTHLHATCSCARMKMP
jgi:hypothetical protein